MLPLDPQFGFIQQCFHLVLIKGKTALQCDGLNLKHFKSGCFSLIQAMKYIVDFLLFQHFSSGTLPALRHQVKMCQTLYYH